MLVMLIEGLFGNPVIFHHSDTKMGILMKPVPFRLRWFRFAVVERLAIVHKIFKNSTGAQI